MLYPSAGNDYLTEAFDLQVSRGLVAGHSTVTVFGYNAVSTMFAITLIQNEP